MAKTFTTSDLSRRSGDIIAEALRGPVTITQRNKPRLVLLNVEDYERLKEFADHRWVGTIEDTPDELFELMKHAYQEYANSPDSADNDV